MSPLTKTSSTNSREYEPGTRIVGTGPILLYVPGIDGTGSLFYRQRPSLLAAGYRVVTYRLRDDALTMEELVDDLGRVLTSAGAGGGRDLGGRVLWRSSLHELRGRSPRPG